MTFSDAAAFADKPFADVPIDAESATRLAAHDLRLGLVDTRDADAFTAWLQADARGFHGGRIAEPQINEQLQHLAYRRTTGVWDDTAVDPGSPVATVSSWPGDLSIPGDQSVAAWAISSVTVAPTHRRRGIARALLEAELRTAHSLGVPLAMLTVSEATIYSRYGFGPATMRADLEIDTRRAAWSGPATSGRVQFVSLEQLRDEGRAVYERARRGTPGEIELDDSLWGGLLGLLGDDKDEAKYLRAVRYDDEAGQPQGFVVYRVTESQVDFVRHAASVEYLCAATDDAYAGLWHYLLELDLVGRVVAPLRSVDEAVRWQVGDFRAVRPTKESDHLWLRILDLTTALEARRYSAPGRLALRVCDPLDFAAGNVLVTIDASGIATVVPLEGEAPDDAAALALSVNDLGSVYLGGVSAHTLARAGRITELRPGSAKAVDDSFRSAVAPRLSTWF